MAKEYDVNYIWDSLADFWKLFDDAPVVDQLWRGYVFTVNNLYYQLYQLDLSKCIHTIPYKWISDWELFVMNDTTVADDSAPEIDGYPFAYKLPYGVKNVTLLRESPRETVVLPNNTMLGPDDKLILPDGSIRYLGDTFFYPEEVIEWDDYLVFPLGITVDVLKMSPVTDYVVDEASRTIHFKVKPYEIMWSNLAIRDLEMIYENFGCLLKYYKPDSYKYLREVQGLWYAYWNGSTITNIEIGINILRDLPFVQEDGVVEQVSSIDRSVTIGDLTFPITETQSELISIGGVVDYIDAPSGVISIDGQMIRIRSAYASLLSIGDIVVSKTDSTSNITVNGVDYTYSGDSAVAVTVGEFIPKFMPLTEAVRVFDYINYPGWWKEYVGGFEYNMQSCDEEGGAYFDTSIFDIGIFDAGMSEKCLEAVFMQYFTFLVRIDSKAWFCNKSELDVVIAFLYAIKPAYTHFLFEFALNFSDDTTMHDSDFRLKNWELRPLDIPVDHHIFDMEAIHPTFDDDSTFDFEDERDKLCISIFGSPHIFYDVVVNGRIFDDDAEENFDNEGSDFDTDPYDRGMVIEMKRRIDNSLNFTDNQYTIDNMEITIP